VSEDVCTESVSPLLKIINSVIISYIIDLEEFYAREKIIGHGNGKPNCF